MRRGPDFLGIGMERAGTSWLFAQLAAHPDIWVPPLKELHFWDVIDPQARQYEPRYNFHLKARLKHKLAPFVRQENRPELYLNSYMQNLKWDWRYFTGAMDEGWYQRLFDPVFTGGRLSGEITPYYANITPETIARIEAMNSNMRYLLMIRDPASRVWSALIYHFVHLGKRGFSEITDDEMLSWLAAPLAETRSDIVGILETWQAAVPDERLFLGKFEDIEAAPETLIKSVYEFLGADSTFLPPSHLYQTKINAKMEEHYKIPARVKAFLVEHYPVVSVRT